MKSRRKDWLFAIALALGLTLSAAAVTTVQVKVACPICKTENSFYDYASWGGYVYSWPSKFQLVYWPHTSSTTIYCCKKCHLSLYLWDFNGFPKDRAPEAAKLLQTVQLSGTYQTYTDIPASEKLQIAEKIYRVLGRDDEFWAHFYRVLGYHLAREKKPKDAAEARQKALEIAQRRLADPGMGGLKKQLLVEAAAMHHFLGKDPAALGELKEASSLEFNDKELGDQKSKDYDKYLSALIQEYIPAIEKGRVPADIEDKE